MWKVGASKRPGTVSNHKWESVAAIQELAENRDIFVYEMSGNARKLNLGYEAKSWARDLIREYGVTFGLHGEFFSSIMSNPSQGYHINYSDPDDYDKFVYSMENSLGFAKFWNCPVVLHPGGKLVNSANQVDLVIRNLSQAIENTGIKPEQIYIENMGKTTQFGTLEHCIRIHNALGTRICVDFAHLYARYMAEYGYFSKEMIQNVFDVMHLLNFPNEQYFHISGMEFNSKGEVRHLPFDKSDFPWQLVLDLIKESGLSGRIIVESGYDYDEKDEYSKGTNLIKDYMEE